jgi:NAD(P)-dependent dehydrogenase (short-subunit alcohol dehydrogenase family)
MALDSTTALVTGMDTELGRAVGARLSASGACVVGHHRSGSRPDLPGDIHLVEADPSDREAVGHAVDAAVAHAGELDILVTCHGRPHHGALLELRLDDFWSVVEDQLSGSFFFAQAAAPSLATGAGGRIVMTSSMWHNGGPQLAAVATAAGGIVALTKSLTRDLGPLGIGVNAIAPGLVDSDWLECDAVGLGVEVETLRRTPGNLVPAGRLGTTEQVANTVALLCDPELKAAVGQIVHVNGGFIRSRN